MNNNTRYHVMTLHNSPFTMIMSGTKTIEMRLYDEKRKRIKEGDTIIFSNAVTKETLYAKVIKLFRYNNFEELYDNHDKISLGYDPEEKASPDDMLLYYTKEQIDENGVLAIEICII